MNENKPISMLCEEFKEAVAMVINTSNLPACLVESILKNYYLEIRAIANQQYRTEKKQYETALKSSKAEKTGSDLNEKND